ncbi:hypothetical protein FRC12_000078 [Ceratobasidium sp. 428]|nr:hypothetical protein FRC12_000078 [Ceratobasidium sp. 428]
MSLRTQGQMKHKLVLTKIRAPTGHSHPPRHQFTPRTLHSPPTARNVPEVPTDQPNAVTPTMIVGICLAVVGVASLGLLVFLRWCRKRRRTAARTSMERGIKVARASVNGQEHPEMQEAWGASDDTHVVDFVYGDKVKSSFDSSDYNALSPTNRSRPVSRAPVTSNVVLPVPIQGHPRPNLKAIDVQRANQPYPFSAPPPFPSTPSSVQNFYGPAIARAKSIHEQGHAQGRESGQGQGLAATSAMRALAVAAGVAPSPGPNGYGDEKKKEGDETVDMPEFSSFRASMFGDGMKLGEHLGIRVDKDRPTSVHSKDSRVSHTVNQPASPVPTPRGGEERIVPPSPSGARPGTAGTFGQPVGSFAGRIPYKAMGHRHAASSLSIGDVRSVRVSYASGVSTPLSAVFKPQHSPKPSFSHGRTQSSGSATVVSTRKVQTVFPPLLPDELVLRVGEKVTLLQTFDDEWCVVGRDRFGEVEIGAVPAFVFTKAKSGETFPRPMRNTSLGVKVEMSSEPTAVWSSREEVISWSNF